MLFNLRVIWWPEEIPTLVINSTTLRPVTPADAEDIYKALQDPLIPEFTTLPANYPLDLAIDLASNRAPASHANKSQLYFAIEDSRLESNYPYKNGFAGLISLHSIDFVNHRAEIGYWLAAEARGIHVGTNAATLITEYGLMTMGFHRIDGVVSIENEPSKKVLLNSGYEYEGIMKQYATRPDGSQIDMALFAATR
jgi:RimJ/RimL family protein N-acetyltransferase